MSTQGFDRAVVIGQIGDLFRSHGYEGTSLARITATTGLGKGSLYNAFPKGKAGMAEEVLNAIDTWSTNSFFLPLETADDPIEAVIGMFDAVRTYLECGDRICLVGAFAIDDTRDNFAELIRRYFLRWRDSLTNCLTRAGLKPAHATTLAEETIASVQGNLILARAMADTETFMHGLARQEARLTTLMRARQRAG